MTFGPLSYAPTMPYGLSLTICLIEVTFSLTMVLLIFIFADMLDCFRDIQKSANEICAALKKESTAGE